MPGAVAPGAYVAASRRAMVNVDPPVAWTAAPTLSDVAALVAASPSSLVN